jgi:hypothetical protein
MISISFILNIILTSSTSLLPGQRALNVSMLPGVMKGFAYPNIVLMMGLDLLRR